MQVNSEGVSSSRVYLPAGQSYSTLLDFFVVNFPHIEPDEWIARFREGLVMTADGLSVVATDAYQPNTHMLYFRRLAREPEIPFEEQILFQDEHILVADKPPLFASHAEWPLFASNFTQSPQAKNGLTETKSDSSD